MLGFSSLRSVISLESKNTKILHIGERFFGAIRYMCLILIKIKIFSCYQEIEINGEVVLANKKGLIKNPEFIIGAYFQSRIYIDPKIPEIKLNKQIIDTSLDWLLSQISEKKMKDIENDLVFVHIRRGDFLHFSPTGVPAILSLEYYLDAIELVTSLLKSPFFIFVTDDVSYVEKSFYFMSNKIISDNNKYIDLGLMALCKHGIMSASTFSWWGAYFSYIKSRESGSSNSLFIAPKYWMGHGSQKWYPKEMKFDWINYI